MTGTLELLCGPSGVGKSSLTREHSSLRWTTRHPRPDELVDVADRIYSLDEVLSIIQNNGIFQSKTAGSFVREDVFLSKLNEGNICGYRKYPDPENGHHYGYPIDLIKKSLDSNENVVEQLADINAVLDIKQKFLEYSVITSLIVGSPFEIRKRLIARDNDDLRRKRNVEDFLAYARNIDLFDEISISNPELINDKEKIFAIIKDVIGNVEEGKPIDTEYDTPDNLFRTIIPEYEELLKTNPSSKELQTFARKMFGERFMPKSLGRMYPGIPEKNKLGSIVNSITLGNQAEYYKIFALLTNTLQQLGFRKDADELSDKLFACVNNYRWNIPPKTCLEHMVWSEFDGLRNVEYTEEYVHRALKEHQEIYKPLVKKLRGEKNPLQILHMMLYSLMLSTTQERFDHSPGLLQLKTIRVANFHKLFKSVIDNIEIKDAILLESHFGNNMSVYANSDLANHHNPYMSYFSKTWKFRNIYYEGVRVRKDVIDEEKGTDTASLAHSFASIMDMQDFKLCGLAISRKTVLDTLAIMEANVVVRFMIEYSMNLLTKDVLSEKLRPFIGFEIFNFVKNSYDILKANIEQPVTLNNIIQYPVFINPRQFVNTYWRENLLSTKEYVYLIKDAVKSYLDIQDRNYSKGLEEVEKNSLDNLKKAYKKLLQGDAHA